MRDPYEADRMVEESNRFFTNFDKEFEMSSKSFDKMERRFWTAWWVILAFNIAFWAVAIYVAVHFLQKVW